MSAHKGEPFGWVYGKGHLMFYKYSDPIKKEESRVLKNGKVETASFKIGYNNPVNNVYDVETQQIVQTFKATLYSKNFMETWLTTPKIILGEQVGIKKTNRTTRIVTDQTIIMHIPKEYEH